MRRPSTPLGTARPGPAGAVLSRSKGRRVIAIARRLQRQYGGPRFRRGDPVDALVGAILSQNTSDVNSDLAFSRLRRRFATWTEVADADTRSIAAAIRPGGLSRVKAPRIKRILRREGLRMRAGAGDG